MCDIVQVDKALSTAYEVEGCGWCGGVETSMDLKQKRHKRMNMK